LSWRLQGPSPSPGAGAGAVEEGADEGAVVGCEGVGVDGDGEGPPGCAPRRVQKGEGHPSAGFAHQAM